MPLRMHTCPQCFELDCDEEGFCHSCQDQVENVCSCGWRCGMGRWPEDGCPDCDDSGQS